MSLPPALGRLHRLGAAAAVAVERWREPLRAVDRLQAGLERYGFDGGDPLAGLLQGAGMGTGLGDALERLALPPPQSAPEAEAAPRRRTRAAFPPPVPDRAAPAAGHGSVPPAAPLRGSEREAREGAKPDGAARIPAADGAAADAAAARRSIGAETAQRKVAGRAAAAGASAAWAQQAIALCAHEKSSTASIRRDSAETPPPGTGSGAAWTALRTGTGAVHGASADQTGTTAPLSALEQVLQRFEAARGGGSGTPGNSAALPRSRVSGAARETAVPSRPGSAGAGPSQTVLAAPAFRGASDPVASAEAPVPGGQPAGVPAPRSRIGGLRGLAALAERAASTAPAPAPSLLAAGAASAVGGALQALTFPAARPFAGGFADALAPSSAGRPATTATGEDGEALARELTRLLRREAERHGIDLDGVGP